MRWFYSRNLFIFKLKIWLLPFISFENDAFSAMSDINFVENRSNPVFWSTNTLRYLYSFWVLFVLYWLKLNNKYTLFGGLAYNTCAYFPSPAGARKNTSNEQKNCYFAIGFYFFGKSIQKHPDSVCENDVNNEQNVRGYYMSNHWTRGWLFYCKKKKLLFWLLFSGKSIQNILILSVRMT